MKIYYTEDFLFVCYNCLHLFIKIILQNIKVSILLWIDAFYHPPHVPTLPVVVVGTCDRRFICLLWIVFIFQHRVLRVIKCPAFTSCFVFVFYEEIKIKNSKSNFLSIQRRHFKYIDMVMVMNRKSFFWTKKRCRSCEVVLLSAWNTALALALATSN